VKLVKVDVREPQALQASIQCTAKMLGAPVWIPMGLVRAHKAAFGADHEALGIWMKRVGDHHLGGSGSIDVGCVEEIDPQVKRSLQQFLRRSAIARRAPDVRAVGGRAHRAEGHAVDDEVAESQRSGCCSGILVLVHVRIAR
jgi:hypothetical protein